MEDHCIHSGAGRRAYFIVRATDQPSAMATLFQIRPDLAGTTTCEVKGEASQDFLDWLQPDKDVFSIIGSAPRRFVERR